MCFFVFFFGSAYLYLLTESESIDVVLLTVDVEEDFQISIDF